MMVVWRGLLNRVFWLMETIESMTSTTIQNRKSNSTIIFSLFAICSILTVMFVIIEHCLTFVPSIVNCNDLPVLVDIEEHSTPALSPNEYEACQLKLRYYYRISPLIVILIISNTLSHLKLTFRLIITLFYFTIVTTLNIAGLSSQLTNTPTNITGDDSTPEVLDSPLLDVSTTSILFALFYIMIFYVCDRQHEISSRLHQLWKAKLQVEQEDVETFGGINKILLENILPQHVAQHFLLYNCGLNKTLYHER